MKKISKLIIILLAGFIIQGCDSSIDVNGGTMSSKSGDGIGSLSGNEDLSEILRSGSFKSISIDLDAYRYDNPSKNRVYKIDMTFEKNIVTGLADCNRFEARYRARDGELSFSKVHIAPANDLVSCEEFPDAAEAVNAFFSDIYNLSGNSEKKIVLDSANNQTSVILSR